MKDTIGIVGCGFVGKAVAKGFAQFADIRIYDVDAKKTTHSFEETIDCDFVFLCLPTPMISAEGGKANLSILNGCIEKINDTEGRNEHSIFILKSTVPIGTTKGLSEQYGDIRIVHNPEFLTARSAIIDFICPARTIVGAENATTGLKVQGLLERRFPGTPCIAMTSQESETVKYMANCFFATKVMFFNEMKLFIDKKELDWNRIIRGVMSDGRIGTSHYEVPGHDGDKGFGGTCFPKDINSLIDVMEKSDVDPIVLKAVWEQNKRIRNNWDWENNSSAVAEENE
jgi:UDPglucose 6-dehydrogenase